MGLLTIDNRFGNSFRPEVGSRLVYRPVVEIVSHLLIPMSTDSRRHKSEERCVVLDNLEYTTKVMFDGDDSSDIVSPLDLVAVNPSAFLIMLMAKINEESKFLGEQTQ